MLGLIAAPFRQFGPSSSGSPPATPSLEVTDNGDGTGAVATISGSAGGSSNTIQVEAIGANGSLTPSTFGPRTGDGSVPLSLSVGAYTARVTSSLGGVYAAPGEGFEFDVTGGGSYNSPHAAVAHAVQQEIINLIGTRISGITADSVRVRLAPSFVDYSSQSPTPSGKHAFPGIQIIYSDREQDLGGVNDRDDIGFPLLIVFGSKNVDSNQVTSYETNDDLFLSWRQAISDVFRNDDFTVTNYARLNPLTFQTCNIEYGPIGNWVRLGNDQIFAGTMTLVFVLRKHRGANPLN